MLPLLKRYFFTCASSHPKILDCVSLHCFVRCSFLSVAFLSHPDALSYTNAIYYLELARAFFLCACNLISVMLIVFVVLLFGWLCCFFGYMECVQRFSCQCFCACLIDRMYIHGLVKSV